MLQTITPSALALIKKYHCQDYSLDDEFLPLIVCKACVATLKAIDKVIRLLMNEPCSTNVCFRNLEIQPGSCQTLTTVSW